jgi:hypothetical protein
MVLAYINMVHYCLQCINVPANLKPKHAYVPLRTLLSWQPITLVMDQMAHHHLQCTDGLAT